MSRATIMIVEDESIVAEDIRMTLESNDYEVCAVFADGESALAAAGRFKPDLILMDIRIEGQLDGIETARQIWEKHRIPIVFLTAHSDEATLERAKLSQPFAYLLKPFQERELCVTVEIALSRRPLAALLELPEGHWYAACQTLLAAANFDLDGRAVMTAMNGERGEALLRLAPLEWPLALSNLDDLSADLLDIVCCIWLQQSSNPDQTVLIRADDCLAFRGLKQQKSGTGHRGGYDDKSRREVATQLNLLAGIELQLPNWRGPLISIQPEADYSWQLRPGSGLSTEFVETRRSVLFSKRLLEYDPYRQKWEKRLARRLSWLWAEQFLQGVPAQLQRLDELLTALRLPIDQKNPSRTKERLEHALDTLQRDGLIAAWSFPGADPEIVGKRGWLSHWLDWKLQISPPQALIEQYAGLAPAVRHQPLANAEKQSSFGFIRHIRAERGLSQARVAAEIGLTQAQLSRIEAGAKVHTATADKIKTWILKEL
ncbi:MAG: hypothetical protein CVV27_11880 [Candidatus Melainabacteria bacterium HGW-Melainabacteria-1]|nr:MAG: hypothetical protein CVV27_11880 [Candidatus Melainabacteria bacterium HGW-Melainabacteria-1]